MLFPWLIQGTLTCFILQIFIELPWDWAWCWNYKGEQAVVPAPAHYCFWCLLPTEERHLNHGPLESELEVVWILCDLEISVFAYIDSSHKLALCHVLDWASVNDVPASENLTSCSSLQIVVCLEIIQDSCTNTDSHSAPPFPDLVGWVWHLENMYLTSIPGDYSDARGPQTLSWETIIQ